MAGVGNQRKMTRLRSPDSTIAFVRDPYRYISRRCRELRTDVFRTRVMLRRTICMTGPEAAGVFYDAQRFRRAGAAPVRIQKTLFGRGGVQGLDGAAHRERKAMFMAMMSPAEIDRLVGLFETEWRAAVGRWSRMPRVVLYDELHPVLTRAVCAWAGVELKENEVEDRSGDLRAMFDWAGSVGLNHYRSRAARTRGERWARGLIGRERALGEPREGEPRAGNPRALTRVAWAAGAGGALLDPRVAAVELLNVLRPVVAVSVYITQLAHALHQHPGQRPERGSGRDGTPAFVQEVRRFYPFFPAAAAVVRRGFEWRGYRFAEGRRVLLDLYGINHDPRLWEDADRFHAARFDAREIGPFDLVPQGGGGHDDGHRCAGEWITIALMRSAAVLLNEGMSYRVPEQDLRLDMRRLPALPRDGMVIAGIRAEPVSAAMIEPKARGSAGCPVHRGR